MRDLRCPLPISLSFQYPICHKKGKIEPRMERGGAYNRPFEILRLRESTLASRSLALHIDRTFDQPCEGGKLNLSIRRVE